MTFTFLQDWDATSAAEAQQQNEQTRSELIAYIADLATKNDTLAIEQLLSADNGALYRNFFDGGYSSEHTGTSGSGVIQIVNLNNGLTLVIRGDTGNFIHFSIDIIPSEEETALRAQLSAQEDRIHAEVDGVRTNVEGTLHSV